MQRNFFVVIGCIISGLIISPVVAAQTTRNGSKIQTIIVDAGHGGTDAGARGSFSTEAQITLELSLRLEESLKNALPNTRILMTRTTDIFHNVREKAKFANDNGGDLFVCVHVNAAPAIRHKEFLRYKTVTYYTGKGKNKKKKSRKEPVYKYWTTPNPANGTSTYVFAADRGDEKASGILEDERFESEAEVEDVPDPTSPEAIIKARLWSQKFFKNSVKLASLIETEFVKAGRTSQGVLQRNHKGIWVLQATNMPAVLIETGFITHKEDENYLNSEEGQNEIVKAITNAVVAYKSQADAPRVYGNDSSEAKVDTPSSQTGQRPPPSSKTDRKPLAVMPPSTKKK